jgi:5-methylcytosine-specific restriction endonuclease McrA
MGVDMNYPATRKEAKATGASHYFTGEPCVRGHVAPRKTKGACVECLKEDWAVDNARRAQLPKSEAAKDAGRRYYEKNKALVVAKAAERPAEERRRARKTWKLRNPEAAQVSANAWKRRARDASPPWLTLEQKAEIAAIYAKARAMTKMSGVKHAVDHIVPLRSPEVCGLHVPWNLQILTHTDNCAKSNKLIA